MALVCKLSRGHYMPPPFTSVQDWFHYAFATSEIKGELEMNGILCFKLVLLYSFISLAIPLCVGTMSTGDGCGHHYGRNGAFCVTVGLLAYWPSQLKARAVNRAGHPADLVCVLA